MNTSNYLQKTLKIGLIFTLASHSNLFSQSKNDTISFPEITLLNDRILNKPEQTSQDITIITDKELVNFPAKNLQDILKYTLGVDIRQRSPFGSQADIAIDGGSFEQTLVLLNGVKIIDHQTAHNTLNLPIILDAIEKIEVIRGPAARKYGANSLTGVLNIITKKAAKDGLFLHAYAGTNFKKNEENISEIYLHKGIQLGGNFSLQNTNNQLYLSHEKGNGYRYNSALENNKIYFQNNAKINNHNILETSIGYIKNSFGANGFYAAPGDKDSKEVVETLLSILQFKNTTLKDLSLYSNVSYRYNFDDYRYNKNNLKTGRSKHYANTISSEIGATYTKKNQEISLGFEYRIEDIKSTNISNHSRQNIGLYIDYQNSINKKFFLNTGAYLNYNSNYKWQIFPGLDISYAILNDLKLNANIGTSQRIPSFTDLYLDQKPGNIGNLNLVPEDAFQTQLGLKFTKPRLNTYSNVMYRKITNFIDWTRREADVPWQANNYANVNTFGFSTNIDYLIILTKANSLKINFKYAYLDSNFEKYDEDLASKYKNESLKHQFITSLNFETRNFSSVLTQRNLVRYNSKTSYIVDLRINYQVSNLTNVYLDIQNLTNSVYEEIGVFPMPSRWISLGIKYVGF